MMDIYAMREHRTLSALFGVLFSAVLIATGALVVADFNGAFSRDLKVTATLPEDGAVVSINSAVHFHGVEVGKVVNAPHNGPDGDVVVDLLIERDQADRIPADVQIAVGPLSVFGNQYVNLMPDPAGTATEERLRSGAVLQAMGENQTPSLQSTFVALDDVLDNVHPAELNAGLSGLAQALSGRGRSLGQTLVSADTFLGDMLELWPTLVDDLEELAPFATTLTVSTPEFLDLLNNTTVTANTLVKNQEAFKSLLGNGAKVSDQLSVLLRETMGTYSDTVGGAAALLESLSQGPRVISELLTGVSDWAGSWNDSMSGGTLKIGTATINVSNPASLALAVVSGKDLTRLLNDAVEGRLVDPPTYTANDCPKYGSQSGTCGGAR